MTRVAVKIEMLRWARDRAGLDMHELRDRFPWIETDGEAVANPTLKQLEAFSSATHAPVGFFFLSKPPVEQLPIPDFRTVGGHRVGRPSPDLLDTIYLCQQRQEWYRDYARSTREEKLPFVGSLTVANDVVTAADAIRNELKFSIEERQQCPTWSDALRAFIQRSDDAGIMATVSGVVGNNNHRRLNPDEFRGFALADEWAPIVFINGADTKAAQMFTLAHELAHIWLGQTALSDADANKNNAQKIEIWCNAVAAELLVPLRLFEREFSPIAPLRGEQDRLARRYKVSTLVILRRMKDVGALVGDDFRTAYGAEVARLRSLGGGSGGNFYLTQTARVSKRFARAIVSSTLEGQTLHRDAFQLLGFSKVATLHELAHTLGVA